MNRISIGADIGGSHITCRLFDLDKNMFVDDYKVRFSGYTLTWMECRAR
jgi:hypothetical protein